MNQLGVSLAWSALQVTAFSAAAVAAHALASRRGPASGAWAASWGLALVALVGLSPLVPRPTFPSDAPARPSTVGKAVPTLRQRGERPESPASGAFRIAWGRLEDRAAAPARRVGAWGRPLAALFLTTAGVGLGRLALGLWGVGRLRRQGRPVSDPSLLRLLGELRGAAGVRRGVALRELPELPTPATAGWLRPVVFLPDDWPTWDDSERRAVLAHELAHVRRGDYATALAARVALALHAYHPLVRWLCSRLLLQQELAADALGARLAGGSSAYLVALSRLALRRDGGGRPPVGPARAFLPAKGTLVRRIAMLRQGSVGSDRDRARPAVRWVTAAALLAAALGVSAFRPPSYAGDAPGASPKPVSDTVRFEGDEFAYVSEGMMGFVAFRPSAVFRRPGMEALRALVVGQFEEVMRVGIKDGHDKDVALFDKGPLRPEAIELMTFGIDLRKVEGQKDHNRQLLVSVPMVRTLEPFDWVKFCRDWGMEPAEVREGDRAYYRLKAPVMGGVDFCLYCPDDRTAVFSEKSRVVKLIRGESPKAPAYAGGAGWRRVRGGLVVAALDNRDGRWTDDLKGSAGAAGASVFDRTSCWFLGVADADDLTVEATADCRDAASVEATSAAVNGLIGLARASAAGKKEIPEPLVKLLDACRVERGDRTLSVVAGGLGGLAGFVNRLISPPAE